MLKCGGKGSVSSEVPGMAPGGKEYDEGLRLSDGLGGGGNTIMQRGFGKILRKGGGAEGKTWRVYPLKQGGLVEGRQGKKLSSSGDLQTEKKTWKPVGS